MNKWGKLSGVSISNIERKLLKLKENNFFLYFKV